MKNTPLFCLLITLLSLSTASLLKADQREESDPLPDPAAETTPASSDTREVVFSEQLRKDVVEGKYATTRSLTVKDWGVLEEPQILNAVLEEKMGKEEALGKRPSHVDRLLGELAKRAPQLETLIVEAENLKEWNLPDLKDLKNLRRLVINSNILRGGLAGLPPSLESFELKEYYDSDGDSFLPDNNYQPAPLPAEKLAEIKGLPKLKTLAIFGEAVTAAHLTALPRFLESLTIKAYTIDTQALGRFEQLKKLRLIIFEGFGSAELKLLAEMFKDKLEELELGNEDLTQADLDLLKSFSSLKKLNLSSAYNLTDDQVKNLQEAMPNTQIEVARNVSTEQ